MQGKGLQSGTEAILPEVSADGGRAECRPGEPCIGSTRQRLIGPVQLAIRSLNPLTGELQWEYAMTSYPEIQGPGQAPTSAKWFWGGVLSTAGGIVFGGLGEWFLALDADTGSELWRVNTGGEIKAAPITFISDGKQLVAIAAGRKLLTFGLEGILTLHEPSGN